MEYALIKAGRIEQIIVADPDFIPHIASQWDQVEPVTGSAGIGWGWDNGFVPPPAPAVAEGA